MECVRIRRDGYPIRFLFQHFYRRFVLHNERAAPSFSGSHCAYLTSRYKLLLRKDAAKVLAKEEASLRLSTSEAFLSFFSCACQVRSQ
jgi:myosin heavy subunit